MNALIIGGTSGLGLEMAELWASNGYQVFVTGRSRKISRPNITSLKLHVDDDFGRLRENIEDLLTALPRIDILIYAAGFRESGHIDELEDEHIVAVTNVSLIAPALLIKRLLQRQKTLPGFIAITSTSQWRARENEPMYCAGKAGLAMLAESLSLDSRIEKTLVVGPSGMDSTFWEGAHKDTTGMLRPEWVAEQIAKLWEEAYSYRMVRILREPTKVEVLASR